MFFIAIPAHILDLNECYNKAYPDQSWIEFRIFIRGDFEIERNRKYAMQINFLPLDRWPSTQPIIPE